MSNSELSAPQPTRKRLEYSAAWVVAFFALLFSAWTLGSHAATFWNIPWLYLSKGAIYLFLLFAYAAIKLAASFADNYCAGIDDEVTALNPPNNLILISLLTSTAALFFSYEYKAKFLIVVIGIFAIWFFSKKSQNLSAPLVETDKKSSSARDGIILLSLVVVATAFSLGAHRPDLDDSSFVQIASQTLIHQDRAPLSYDASLGQVLEPFRFAPYRISAYETLIALISDWTGISLTSVYYVVVPGVTAGLTILVAFIFSRWFLPTNGAALLASAFFLLIMFTWGETHRAFGNFGFVRNFQGKGLIIALTTPFALITGLSLIRRPVFLNAVMLAVANICAIGVSSSGLVMTIFTSLLICAAAITSDLKKLVFSYLLVSITLIYPTLLSFWIKFQSKTHVPLSEVGTYLPINASLGLGFRESTALAALILGFSIFIANQKKTYYLLVGAVILFILNPWFSDLMSNLTSRNMSWRLAWAAPVPLLMSIGLVSALSVVVKRKSLRIDASGTRLISIGLLFLFVVSNTWVTSPANNVTWGYPSSKLPPEFYSTSKIADKIRTLNLKGAVLAHRDVAAWMPLASPGVKLVMPGHTYPIQLQTILPKSDFEARMRLFNAAGSSSPNLNLSAKEMRKFNVELVVLPDGVDPMDNSRSRGNRDHLYAEKIESISGYSLFRVHWRS